MKIIHLVNSFYPYIVGGGEIYLENLVDELSSRGHQSVIAYPFETSGSYKYKDTEIRQIGVDWDVHKHHQFYTERDNYFKMSLARLVAASEPDVLHIHITTPYVALTAKDVALEYDVPTVITSHNPGLTCMTDLLMGWNNTPCDGEIIVNRCTACVLQKHGIDKTLSKVYSVLPAFIGKIPEQHDLRGGIWTGLRLKELVKKRNSYFLDLMDSIDRTVVLNDWHYDVLRRNGVSDEKIKIVRLGITARAIDNNETVKHDNASEKIRLVFLGRLVQEKGLDIILEALAGLPGIDIELDVYGISVYQVEYEQKVRSKMEKASGVNLMNPLEYNDVVNALKSYDYLLVPSQTMEGGPLVVLEAFAAGIPVIGSDLGAINEHVKHECNGLLVRHDSIRQWSETLSRVADDRDLHGKLKKNVKPPRTINEVANDMVSIYEELTH